VISGGFFCSIKNIFGFLPVRAGVFYAQKRPLITFLKAKTLFFSLNPYKTHKNTPYFCRPAPADSFF